MSVATNARVDADDASLRPFELSPLFVRPLVELLRLANTAADAIFYDVPSLIADLHARDRDVAVTGGKRPSRIIDLDALANPEGALLLIDAATPPYVHRFDDVHAFLDSPHPETKRVDIVSITGVGSSALGSAALAWDLSKALAAPVLAIVPGYGVADIVLQGLGGWFGFGLHDWLNTKATVQNAVATVAPAAAGIGRALSASTPEAKTLNGAPIFRHGSGSSDVLHALMRDRASPFRLLVGHSKGALQIGNAIRTLDADRTDGMTVVTLGCPIAAELPQVQYRQYLGLYDALGQLNMWGHWPDHWVPTWHTTNVSLPAAMRAGDLVATVGVAAV